MSFIQDYIWSGQNRTNQTVCTGPAVVCHILLSDHVYDSLIVTKE